MIDIAQPVFGPLVYPGLLWGLLLTLLLGRTAQARLPGGGLRRGVRAALGGSAPLALLLGTLLPLLALAFLPWPYGWQPISQEGRLLIFWGLLEVAFALALLPGLSSVSPYAPRAAIREAQIGIAGRAVLWLAVGLSLAAGAWGDPLSSAARVFALGSLLLALPAAAVWGPFSASGGTTPGGAEAGLSQVAVDLARWGRWSRLTALAALTMLVTIPADAALLPDPYRLALIVLGLLLIALGLRYVRGRLVARPLPDALHYCWWRALPLALLGLVALLLG